MSGNQGKDIVNYGLDTISKSHLYNHQLETPPPFPNLEAPNITHKPNTQQHTEPQCSYSGLDKTQVVDRPQC